MKRSLPARSAVLVATVTALAMTACSHPGPVASKPKSSSPSATASVKPKVSPRSHASTKSPLPAESSAAAGKAQPKGPRPLTLPWTPDPSVPVSGEVTPGCTLVGGVLTLTVHTEPLAGVAYLAVYSDNGTGAGKGYGADYGGNDGGKADSRGVYRSSWTVSKKAPAGPARVDIFVSTKQGKNTHATAPFSVGTTTC